MVPPPMKAAPASLVGSSAVQPAGGGKVWAKRRRAGLELAMANCSSVTAAANSPSSLEPRACPELLPDLVGRPAWAEQCQAGERLGKQGTALGYTSIGSCAGRDAPETVPGPTSSSPNQQRWRIVHGVKSGAEAEHGHGRSVQKAGGGGCQREREGGELRAAARRHCPAGGGPVMGHEPASRARCSARRPRRARRAGSDSSPDRDSRRAAHCLEASEARTAELPTRNARRADGSGDHPIAPPIAAAGQLTRASTMSRSWRYRPAKPEHPGVEGAQGERSRQDAGPDEEGTQKAQKRGAGHSQKRQVVGMGMASGAPLPGEDSQGEAPRARSLPMAERRRLWHGAAAPAVRRRTRDRSPSEKPAHEPGRPQGLGGGSRGRHQRRGGRRPSDAKKTRRESVKTLPTSRRLGTPACSSAVSP